MGGGPANVYDDAGRARAYSALEFPGTYLLAYRDLPRLFREHVTGTRALDFGCGAGRSTRYLRDHGFDVVGVDIARPMVERARELDPRGDYRVIREGDLERLEPGGFDLVLAAFTFDNVPDPETKRSILASLRRALAPRGRIVAVVSSPDIYVHEWASFSTRDFPENRAAADGDTVRIVMLDVPDRRPVEDVLCGDRAYRGLFAHAELAILETLRPLATGDEPVTWVSETRVAPWTIYVVGPAAGSGVAR